jgi:hypothetical protein
MISLSLGRCFLNAVLGNEPSYTITLMIMKDRLDFSRDGYGISSLSYVIWRKMIPNDREAGRPI